MRLSISLFVPTLLAFVLAACQTAIVDNLGEAQANDVVLALDERGIASQKSRAEGSDAFRVLVGNDDVSLALRTLREEELPAHDEAGLASVFEEPGLVPTATEERARLMAALSGDVARSIESIDGVVRARVHIALPDPRNVVLDAEPPRPRASVLIKHRDARAPYDIASIRALVAGAVEGLRPDDITVVGTRAHASVPSRAAFVNIGPIAVSRGSAMAFKVAFGLAIAINIALAGLLIAVLLRRRTAGATAPT